MSSFFSKQSIAAGPGFNRWLVPPAALAIHLCIGSVYAWSIFNTPLMRVDGVIAGSSRDWTLSQVVSIFTGKTVAWSAVPGATASGPIDVISRTSVAGVLTNFQTLFLEGKKVSTKAAEEPSEGLMRAKVESDPSSIGFVSNYQSDQGTVNAVGYNGVACNHENVKAGTYAGTARFYEVTKGKATGASSAFIGWIERSAAAAKIIDTQWLTI